MNWCHEDPLRCAVDMAHLICHLCVAVIIDIHMMLIGGFGFLMTFLRRFGFSALGLTMIVTAFATGRLAHLSL